MKNSTEILFVGALNVDHVFSIGGEDSSFINQLLMNNFNVHGEKQTSDDHVEAVLNMLSDYPRHVQLSGSSFIAMHAAAKLFPHMKLGCVGVAGTTPNDQPLFEEWLQTRGIDDKLVRTVQHTPAATCVALTFKGQRSLLTAPGANTLASAYFIENRKNIINEATRSKAIHYTSFFDDLTPSVILEISKEIKKIAPNVHQSLDPGFRWITTKPDFVLEFTNSVDTLFVNPSEFDFLFGNKKASRLTEIINSHPNRLRVIRKSPSGIEIYIKYQGKVKCYTYKHETITIDKIVDDTGAGDVFAGTLLAQEVCNFSTLNNTISTSVNLAKAKLQRMGQDFDDFSELLDLAMTNAATVQVYDP